VRARTYVSLSGLSRARQCTGYDDRDIDVEQLAGLGGTDAFFRLGRIDTPSRSAPAPLTDEPGPCSRSCEHPADALGVQGEHANGHVPILHRGRHVMGYRHLLGSKLSRYAARAAAAVVEAARLIQAMPGVVAGRGEAEHSQCDGERDALLCSFDGAEDGGLGFTGRHPLAAEAHVEQADQGEQQPHDADQQLDAPLELQDPGAELLLVLTEQLRGDYRSGATANPACSG